MLRSIGRGLGAKVPMYGRQMILPASILHDEQPTAISKLRTRPAVRVDHALPR